MIRLSLIIAYYLFFLSSNSLAQDLSVQNQESLDAKLQALTVTSLCDTESDLTTLTADEIDAQLYELKNIAQEAYGRLTFHGAPGMSREIPTMDDVQKLDNKFDELKCEVEIYLSEPRNDYYFDNEYVLQNKKFRQIELTHSVAMVILYFKIYMGLDINELNIEKYNLVIPTDGMNELSGFPRVENWRQSDDTADNTDDDATDNTVIEMDEDGDNVVLKINPKYLMGVKLAVEMSHDSDEAFSKLVTYPIINLYLDSIMESQILRGVEPEFPHIQALIESNYEATSILSKEFWENKLKVQREKIFRDTIYESFLELMFKPENHDPNQYNSIRFMKDWDEDTLTGTINEAWLDMKLVDEEYLEEFDKLDISKLDNYITDKSLINSEFLVLRSYIETEIQYWISDLHCPQLGECLRDNFLKEVLAEILSEAKVNTQRMLFQVFNNLNPNNNETSTYRDLLAREELPYTPLTRAEHNLIFADDSGFVSGPLDNAKLRLKNKFLQSNLLDSWVDEIIKQVELQDEDKQTQYINHLIDISEKIYNLSPSSDSNIEDYPIDVEALYNTILFQKDLLQQLGEEGIADIDYYFVRPIVQDKNNTGTKISYNNAKQNFCNTIQTIYQETYESDTTPPCSFDRFNREGLVPRNASEKLLSHLFYIGRSMGFFITTESNEEPPLTEIFANLSNPATGFWEGTKKLFGQVEDPQWYENKYREIYRTNELNKERILDKQFSIDKDKNIYESIYELCADQNSIGEECLNNTKELLNQALLSREEMLKEEVNKLVTQDGIADIIKTALQYPDIDIAGFLQSQYPIQFAFHADRLTAHQGPGRADVVLQTFYKIGDTPMWTALVAFIGGGVSNRFGGKILGSGLKKFLSSAGAVARGCFTVMWPIWIYKTWHSRNGVLDRKDAIESFYYSTLEPNEVEMVSLALLEESEQQYAMANTMAWGFTGGVGIFTATKIAVMKGLISKAKFASGMEWLAGSRLRGGIKRVENELKVFNKTKYEFNWNMETLALAGPRQRRARAVIERFYSTYERIFKRQVVSASQKLGLQGKQSYNNIMRQIGDIKNGAPFPEGMLQKDVLTLENSLKGSVGILSRQAERSAGLGRKLFEKLKKFEFEI